MKLHAFAIVIVIGILSGVLGAEMLDDGKKQILRKVYRQFLKTWNNLGGDALFPVTMPLLSDLNVTIAPTATAKYMTTAKQIITAKNVTTAKNMTTAQKMQKLYERFQSGKMSPLTGDMGGGSCAMGAAKVNSSGYDGYAAVGMGMNNFFSGTACGMCIEIKYKGKRYIGLIKDSCGGCPIKGGFNVGLPIKSGFRRNQWMAVPCPVSGELQYRFTQDNKYWTQMAFNNNRFPIAYIEYKPVGSDSWKKVEPVKYASLFIMKMLPDDGVLEVKVTDINDNKFAGRTNGWNSDFQEFSREPGTGKPPVSAHPSPGTRAPSMNVTQPPLVTQKPRTVTLAPSTLYDLFTERSGFMSPHLPSEYSGSCGVPADIRPPSAGYEGYAAVALGNGYYHDSQTCGMCMEIKYNGVKYLGIVKDVCFGCPAKGGFDIAMNLPPGWIPNRWKGIPCPVDGNMKYRFTEKNLYWTQLTFHNYRNLIHSVVYKWPGETAWRKTEAAKHGAFFIAKGVPADGKITVKVTDIYGHEVTGHTQGWNLKYEDFGVQQ